MKPIARWRQVATILITIGVLAALAVVVAVDQWLLVDLPHPDQLYQHTSAPSTKIFDRNGTLLYEITDPHQGCTPRLRLMTFPKAAFRLPLPPRMPLFTPTPALMPGPFCGQWLSTFVAARF
jgi:hypothetical protein